MAPSSQSERAAAGCGRWGCEWFRRPRAPRAKACPHPVRWTRSGRLEEKCMTENRTKVDESGGPPASAGVATGTMLPPRGCAAASTRHADLRAKVEPIPTVRTERRARMTGHVPLRPHGWPATSTAPATHQRRTSLHRSDQPGQYRAVDRAMSAGPRMPSICEANGPPCVHDHHHCQRANRRRQSRFDPTLRPVRSDAAQADANRWEGSSVGSRRQDLFE